MNDLNKYFHTALEIPDGIKKLRELILTLAMQGKLVPQDPKDEPASELLKEIEKEKRLTAKGTKNTKEELPPIKAEEVPYSLPKGWEWVRLIDICSDIGDIDHKMPIEVKEGIPYVSPRDFYGKNEIDFKNAKKISQKDFLILSKKIKPEYNDIIFPRYGTIGVNRLVETNIEFLVSYSCTILKMLKYSMNAQYVFYYSLSSVTKSMIYKYTVKTTQPNVGTKSIKSFLFPLPPLNEQKRIVAKIDSLMALCDRLEKERNLRNEKRLTIHSAAVNGLLSAPDEKSFSHSWKFISKHFDELYSVPQNVAELKKTILQLAVMGKLVPQDSKDQPASELLKEIEKEKKLTTKGTKNTKEELPPIKAEEVPYSLPKGWEWVRLGDVMLKITDGTHHSPPNIDVGKYKYISAKNIKNYGIELKNVTYVTEEIHREIYSRCNPTYGDILYIKDGATTGIATINNLKEEFSLLSSVAVLKLPSQISNIFLLNVLRSPFFYDNMRGEMSGVAITRVTLKKLNDAIIPLPPLNEQKRIVAKIDELMALCDAMEKHINSASNKQSELFNAVLSKI